MIIATKTTVSLHLLQRLKEIGIDTVFGVPGDFNLNFLDVIEGDKSLTWGRNVNELNAAYAADGYARVKGAGAILTTFGVGELSAVNGIAGSYAEKVPVIHVVGMPSTTSMEKKAYLHHTFGNGEFSMFHKMASHVTVAAEVLSVKTAAQQIDHVITQCLLQRRPGYIGIPCDIALATISVLQEKLDYSIPKSPVGAQKAAAKAILDAIGQAKHPIILLDRCATRNDVKGKVNDFVIASGFPVYSKPNGLGVINHCVPNYRGCYIGASSLAQIRQEVLGADLVLEIGSEALDINTGGFTLNLDPEKVISFDSFCTKVFHSMFENVAIQELLPIITKRFPVSCKVDTQQLIESQLGPRAQQTYTTDNDNRALDQAYFWSKLASYLPEKVTLVTEVGTPTLGTFNLNLPKDCTLITQLGWASIGYGIPATLGAAIADRSKPVILLVGDGSFQVSVQEVSVMLYHGVCPIIILFNNDGYLIEKLVHGDGYKYNDIQMWEYAETFRYFGGDIPVNQDRALVNTAKIGIQKKIHAPSELDAAMAQAVAQSDRIHFLELVFPADDVPKSALTFVSSYKQ